MSAAHERADDVDRYEIQGRKLERTGGRRVRNHVRLASADDRDTALGIAAEMAAGGFATWVFHVSRRSGRTSYQLLDGDGRTSAGSR